MSTSTSDPGSGAGIIRGVWNLSKFLAASYALWIVSGALMWTVIRPQYMPHNPEAYYPVLVGWFIGTCLATWLVGTRY